MASGILSHHFTATNGFLVAPTPHGTSTTADLRILRMQQRFPGDRDVVVHTLVVVKGGGESLVATLERMEEANMGAGAGVGCWAVVVLGAVFAFYEYRRERPLGSRLVPWGPPEPPRENRFHVRRDVESVEWMLRYMARNASPSA